MTSNITHLFEDFISDQAAVRLDDVNYSFVGLAGETGEALEWHKKINLRQTNHQPDKPLPSEADLLSELGDILHYLTRIGLHYGFSLEDIMVANVDKIQKRVEARNANRT